MDAIEGIIGLLLCLFLTLILLKAFRILETKTRAPGPWGFPVVGHLPLFGLKPTKTFNKWWITYGDVYRIRLGSWNAVVLNGFFTVKGALERTDDAFSSRPPFFSAKIMKSICDNIDTIPLAPFNMAYLNQKKLKVAALNKFTKNCKNIVEELVKDEVDKLANSWLLCKEKPLDIDKSITHSAASTIYQVLFGKCDDVRQDREFIQLFEASGKFPEFVGPGNPIDVLPWLRFLLREKVNKFKIFIKTHHAFWQRQAQEHIKSMDMNHLGDVTDMFLAENLLNQVADKTIDIQEGKELYTLIDLLGAALDTTAITLKWVILFMAAFPKIQAHIQQEIDEVVLNERSVNIYDKTKLHYTQAALLEIMRISSVVPLALPHSARIDATINGYDIDKDTVVIVNLHSMNYDDSVWENSEDFKPERHLDTNNMFMGHSPVVVFGLGRRRCIGEYLAKDELFLYSTLLLQRLSFDKPENTVLDLEPLEMLTNNPKPFHVIVKERKK